MNLVYSFVKNQIDMNEKLFLKKTSMKRKKIVNKQNCSTLKKERKVGKNIKPKFGLFKLGPWAPQVFKREELYIKWA